MSKRMQFGLALLTFLVVLLVIDLLFKTQGVQVTNWSVSHAGQVVERTIPINEQIPESGLYVFEATIPDPLRDCLVIPRVNGYAMRVVLNGVEIGSIGDMQNPTANIWNHSHLFRLLPGQLKATNTLRIELYGLHDIGLPFAPFFTDHVHAANLVDLQNLYTDGFASLIIGATATLIIMLAMLAAASASWRRVFMYFTLANAFYLIYNFDFTYRLSSGSLSFYLWVQKGIVLSIYLSALFLILGMKELTKSKRLPWIFWVMNGISAIAFLVSPNFVALRGAMNVCNVFLLISFAYMLRIDHSNAKSHLYYADMLMALTVFHTVLVSMFRLQSVYMLQIGVFAMLVGQSLTLVTSLANLEKERNRLSRQLMTDPLTGVNNRMWLQMLKPTAEDSLMFLDIDNFKKLNDTRGHRFGDEVLRRVATVLTHHTRTMDEVIRYGGDEFLVLFRSADEAQAGRRAQQISSVLQHSTERISISWGIVQFNGSLADDIARADERMYEMKRKRDNPVSIG